MAVQVTRYSSVDFRFLCCFVELNVFSSYPGCKLCLISYSDNRHIKELRCKNNQFQH